MHNCIKMYSNTPINTVNGFCMFSVLIKVKNKGDSRKWKVNLNHCIFMLYKSAETCHPVSLPCKGTNMLIFVTCRASFYLRVWSVQPPIQSLYPGIICIYMQECSVYSLIHLPFHGCNVRAWNLFWASVAKLVLWQLMILLPCILAHTSSIPMGANKFLHARTFFTLDRTNIYSDNRSLAPC